MYTKENCIAWIKNPQYDPVGDQHSLLDDRVVFKMLLDQCKQLLTPDEIREHNIEMLPVIYPNVRSNSFEIPTEITYNLTKLSGDKSLAFNYIEDLVSKSLDDDEFITKLLNSEKNYLIAHASNSDRLQMLDTITPELINDKRQHVLDALKMTRTLLGQSRQHVRGLIYRAIYYFTLSSDLSCNYLVVGHHGTGRTKIAQVLANLYYHLGLIDTPRLESDAIEDGGCGLIVTNDIHHYDPSRIYLVVRDDDQEAQRFLGFDEQMRQRFPNTIYLTDYTGSDLAEILLTNLRQNLPPLQIDHIKQLISMNYKLFKCQAKDMLILSDQMLRDSLIIASQNQPYEIANITMTVKKFFLNKGLYMTFKKEMEMTIVPLSQLTDNMTDILNANLLSREQLLKSVEDDQFIKDVIGSKHTLLINRIAQHSNSGQYLGQLKSQLEQFQTLFTTETVRTSILKIIGEIDAIQGQSRQHIRRLLYSQIYLFSKSSIYVFENLMNYLIIGPHGSNKGAFIKAISLICEHLGFFVSEMDVRDPHKLDSLLGHVCMFDKNPTVASTETSDKLLNYLDLNVGSCGLIMTTNNINIVKNFEHVFPNYLLLIPYTSDDLIELLLSDHLTLSESQLKYIKQLIDRFNTDNLFTDQAIDLNNLSRQIKEDMILSGESQYGIEQINSSFQRFFYNKGYSLDFPKKVEQTGGGSSDQLQSPFSGTSIRTVFNNAKQFRLNYL
jgi:energy-coupling factor transporter ATP-binding protein EcfA2